MRYILASAAVVGCVLMSGFVDINIEHHMHLPEFNKTRIVESGVLSHTYNIYLSNKIKDMGKYDEIIDLLAKVGKRDKVIFHLNGYGGSVDGVINIQTAIYSTQAKVIMKVDAPVYSGHAYLALTSGTELIMAPHTFLMLHSSSVLNADCSKEDGEDRGVSNKEHCQAMKDVLINQNIQLLSEISILTTDEIGSLMSGHDLYLTKEEVEKRQSK